MAKTNLLTKIARAFSEEEEVTSEDLDQELAAAVSTIRKAGVELVDNDEITGENWGQSGDKLFVLNLAPIYAAMGSRSERLMFGAKTICEHTFEREIPAGGGNFYFEGDHFVMQLTGMSDEAGFRKASLMVNQIGTQILGARFAKLKVPGLLVAADAGEVTNEDGSLNMTAIGENAKNGGISVRMQEPEEGDPVWMQIRWKTKLSGRGNTAGMGSKDRDMDPKEWEEIRRKAKQAKAKPVVRKQSDWVQRKAKNRRAAAKRIKFEDRRHSFDRRGRGH